MLKLRNTLGMMSLCSSRHEQRLLDGKNLMLRVKDRDGRFAIEKVRVEFVFCDVSHHSHCMCITPSFLEGLWRFIALSFEKAYDDFLTAIWNLQFALICQYSTIKIKGTNLKFV